MRLTKQVIQDNPVKAALQLAHKVEVPLDPAAARKMLDKKRSEARRLRDLKADLLPIERESFGDLDKKLNDVNIEIDALISALVPNPKALPVLDLACLTWRDDQGFPRLVPYDLDATSHKIAFGLRVSTGAGWQPRIHSYSTPTLPKLLRECYGDLTKTLRELRQKGKNIEISTRFEGTIPDHIRDLIYGAKHVFKELYIVAEASNWIVTHREAPKRKQPSPDPLLIGFDGEQYRLIAAFDTTTIEQLAADRSHGKKPS